MLFCFLFSSLLLSFSSYPVHQLHHVIYLTLLQIYIYQIHFYLIYF